LNRMHAILGASEHCIATHPSDMCVALAALDAIVHVQGPQGARAIPIAEVHRLPGDTPHIDTTLQPAEIVTSIELPARGFPGHYAYLKVRDRASFAFALVSVAVALEMDGASIRTARIALGGVAHKPWRVGAAEEMLQASNATEASFLRVAEAYLAGARGCGQNAFKIALARRAIVRALTQAVTMEKTDDRHVHRTTTEPR
jgi:xanthine dehydrogenase YagS FAD-binding subunit